MKWLVVVSSAVIVALGLSLWLFPAQTTLAQPNIHDDDATLATEAYEYAPLLSSQLWYLDSESGPASYEMEKGGGPGDDGQTGSVSLAVGNSAMWLADQAAACDVAFSGGSWIAEIRTDADWIHPAVRPGGAGRAARVVGRPTARRGNGDRRAIRNGTGSAQGGPGGGARRAAQAGRADRRVGDPFGDDGARLCDAARSHFDAGRRDPGKPPRP